LNVQAGDIRPHPLNDVDKQWFTQVGKGHTKGSGMDDDEAVADGFGQIIGTGKLKLVVVCLVAGVCWCSSLDKCC